MLLIAQPVDRFFQRQARGTHQHGSILQLIETGRQAVEYNGAINPFARAFNIPARLHRGEMAIAPVAPLPAAAVGHKVVGLAIKMQDKIPHLLLMGAQNSLQAAINALLRHFDARQRPADFIDIQRIDDPPARTQQRAGVKIEHRRGKRPAQLRGQSGIKNQIAELGLAGQL